MTHVRVRKTAAWPPACVLWGALALGCGGQSYAGLANVPNPNRPWSPDDRGRDAVSNGGESCAPSGRSADDPLRSRIPPCPEQPPSREIKPPRRAAPAPAGVNAAPAPPARP